MELTVSLVDCKYDVVKDTFKRKNWKLVYKPGESCHLYWYDVTGISGKFTAALSFNDDASASASTYSADSGKTKLQNWQYINHFPGMMNLARKSRLAQHLDSMRRQFLTSYSFYPRTWVLPLECSDFRTQFDSRGMSSKVFIIKPDTGCQGKGIHLVQNFEEINVLDASVAQLYIKRPLLIDGFKFDLRLYVLITSVKPLRLYLFKDGLLRFCTRKYEKPQSINMKDRFMHLTNYAINKSSEDYDPDPYEGSKRSMKWFLEYLAGKHSKDASELLWKRIGQTCTKTIISILPTLVREYDRVFGTEAKASNCFQILGVDLLVDQNLKPWLIEVNHLPSFSTASDIDVEVKAKLIDQAVEIIQAKPSDRKKYARKQKKAFQRRNLLSSNDIIKEKIRKIYTIYAPEKVEKIDSIMQRFEGQEKELLASIKVKYCSGRARRKTIFEMSNHGSTGQGKECDEEESRLDGKNCWRTKALEDMIELQTEVHGHGTTGPAAVHHPVFTIITDKDAIEWEQERLKDFQCIYPKGAESFKTMVKYVFEQEARQQWRLLRPLNQVISTAPSRGDVSSMHEKLVQSSAVFRPLQRSELLQNPRKPPPRPTPQQIEAAERLSKGYSSHDGRHMMGNERCIDYDDDRSISSTLVSRIQKAIDYGREYRRKLRERYDAKFLDQARVPIKVHIFDIENALD